MASLPRPTPSEDVVPSHVTVNNPPDNPFDSLPIETVQQIAEEIESDISLCNFSASCRSARDAINGDNFSLWRRKFHAQFEKTGWDQQDNFKYKKAYHDRRRTLKNGAVFGNGRKKNEQECLEVVRELIIGACADPDTSTNKIQTDGKICLSNNTKSLITFLKSSNLLQIIFKPRPVTARTSKEPYSHLPDAPLLQTIRVICAPLLLSLNEHFDHSHYGFPDSQLAVYSPATWQPFFGGPCGLDINMELVLHNINFWRYHMVRPVEQTLYTPFAQLSQAERPQWWREQLKQGGQSLGKSWKGSYAYLDHKDLAFLRELNGYDADVLQIQDKFAGEDAAFAFQDMELQVVGQGEKVTWPAMWERMLGSLTPPTPTSPTSSIRTRAQKKSGVGATPEEVQNFQPLSFRFNGSGSDDEESFLASGWLNPLPPQQGIPGWQRLTMMKYFQKEDGSGAIDMDSLWAYEGVVFPGGKIVVGRWWSPDANAEPDDDQYSGPFVLWCVDGAEGYHVVEEEVEEDGQAV